MASKNTNNLELLDPPRVNWALYRPNQTGVYKLALVDIVSYDNTAKVAVNPGIFTVTSTTLNVAEFQFNVNPQALSMEEPAAVNIIPTQDGGHFVEHQGQLFKNITIKGTTGLRPNRGKGGLIPVNEVNAGTAGVERTGFEDLIDLRNLFRAYWSIKRNTEFAYRTVMVWQNGKDGELFVVEPLNFKIERDSSSPLTSSYEIQLKTLQRLDVSDLFKIKDSRVSRSSVDKFLSRVNSYTKSLAIGVTLVESGLDNLLSQGAKVSTRILAPVHDILDGLSGIVTTSNRVVEIPRSLITDTISSIDELALSLESRAIVYANTGFIDGNAQSKRDLRLLQRTLTAVHSEDRLFATKPDNKIERRSRAFFTSALGIQDSGGEPLDIRNAESGVSINESVINGGEDIRGVAKRLLGVANKWKSLVLYNNLKPPYVSSSGDGINVLRPGDNIKYPSAASKIQSGTTLTSEGNRGALPSTLEAFGRDVKLSHDSLDLGIDSFDLSVNPDGDLTTVEALENMIQAIEIKFNTERGDLDSHPEFGIKFPIGAKFLGPTSTIEFQMYAKASILADPRIQDVTKFGVGVVGNTMSVNANIILDGVAQALPVDFNIRR